VLSAFILERLKKSRRSRAIEKAELLQTWCGDVLSRSIHYLDDYQRLFLRWLTWTISTQPEILSLSDLAPFLPENSEVVFRSEGFLAPSASGSKVYDLTLEAVWSALLIEMHGEQAARHLKKFPTPRELRDMVVSEFAKYDRLRLKDDEKARTNHINALWDFGFLITHLYYSRSCYGLTQIDPVDGDHDLMQTLLSLGKTRGLADTPDLLAEIVFCVGLYMYSTKNYEFKEDFYALASTLRALESSGELPLEPALEDRARLHGQFVFCHAMLMLNYLESM
jgi:hypothetical protein